MTQHQQARLKVLNSLLADYVTIDQAATLMGVSMRHAWRLLVAYRKEGATALAHSNRGQRPWNITSEMMRSRVICLARTRYSGANHTHLSELLREHEGIDIGRTTLRLILVYAGVVCRSTVFEGSVCQWKGCWYRSKAATTELLINAHRRMLALANASPILEATLPSALTALCPATAEDDCKTVLEPVSEASSTIESRH